MLCCHDTSIYLACSYQKARWEKGPSYNICLIGRNKIKRWKLSITSLAMLQCTNIWRPWVLSIMPKIPEILVGSQMERSILVSSVWNIWNHLWRWSTYFGQTGPTKICRSVFDKLVHCPVSLHLCREFGKGIKNGKSRIPLSWPGLIGKCHFIFLGYWQNGSTPHVINTILGYYARFWTIFLTGIFWELQKETHSSRLAGSQNSLPQRCTVTHKYWIVTAVTVLVMLYNKSLIMSPGFFRK